MIYITGDTHNINDMSNLSAKNMKLCCMEQGNDYAAITHAIVLGDFGLPWYKCPVDEQGIHPTDKTDKHLRNCNLNRQIAEQKTAKSPNKNLPKRRTRCRI